MDETNIVLPWENQHRLVADRQTGRPGSKHYEGKSKGGDSRTRVRRDSETRVAVFKLALEPDDRDGSVKDALNGRRIS